MMLCSCCIAAFCNHCTPPDLALVLLDSDNTNLASLHPHPMSNGSHEKNKMLHFGGQGTMPDPEVTCKPEPNQVTWILVWQIRWHLLEPDNTCSRTSQTLAMYLVVGDNTVSLIQSNRASQRWSYYVKFCWDQDCDVRTVSLDPTIGVFCIRFFVSFRCWHHQHSLGFLL